MLLREKELTCIIYTHTRVCKHIQICASRKKGRQYFSQISKERNNLLSVLLQPNNKDVLHIRHDKMLWLVLLNLCWSISHTCFCPGSEILAHMHKCTHSKSGWRIDREQDSLALSALYLPSTLHYQSFRQNHSTSVSTFSIKTHTHTQSGGAKIGVKGGRGAREERQDKAVS